MCLEGFEKCKCERCKIKTSYIKADQKLGELNKDFMKAQKNYKDYLEMIRTKLGSKADRFSFNSLKVNSDYDQTSKKLWLKYKEADQKCQKQIYRLNSLERKADLYEVNLYE